jgi:hypothetical protein
VIHRVNCALLSLACVLLYVNLGVGLHADYYPPAVRGANNLATGGNPGPCAYVSAAATLNADSNSGGGCWIDATNHRLGVGTNSPQHPLHVVGATGHSGSIAIDNADGMHQSIASFYMANVLKYEIGAQNGATDMIFYDATDGTFIDHNTSAATLTVTDKLIDAGLPTTGTGGGLYACVDAAGNFYRKSTCP